MYFEKNWTFRLKEYQYKSHRSTYIPVKVALIFRYKGVPIFRLKEHLYKTCTFIIWSTRDSLWRIEVPAGSRKLAANLNCSLKYNCKTWIAFGHRLPMLCDSFSASWILTSLEMWNNHLALHFISSHAVLLESHFQYKQWRQVLYGI